MKIKEVIVEVGQDNIFQRYRQLGQEPIKLAGHLADKVFGGDQKSRPVANVAKSKPVVSAPDDGDTKAIINKILTSQDLDDRDKERLRAWKNQSDDAEANATIDRALRGAGLDSQNMQVLKRLKYQL